MIQVLQIGVAAWMCYEAIRAVTSVPAALQPILVAAICYGLTFAPPIVLLVLNAAAVTAIIRLFVGYTAKPAPVGSYRSTKRAAKPSRIPDLP